MKTALLQSQIHTPKVSWRNKNKVLYNNRRFQVSMVTHHIPSADRNRRTPDAPVSDSSAGWDLPKRGSDAKRDHPWRHFGHLQTRLATACDRQRIQCDLHGLPPKQQRHGAPVSAPLVAPEAHGASTEGEHLPECPPRLTPAADQTECRCICK